jgi:DNA polymerase IV
MDRVAMYIDMDAYFASVEQASRPHLRGRPMAVVGSGKRTVIVASSYEAKRLGIKTGMTKTEALKILPSLVFVEGRNNKYVDTCVRVHEILLKYTPDVEICSIDEFFVDFTHSLVLFPSILDAAGAIKEEIRANSGITCSVGIGPNRLIAKMAGESGKPNGLVMIKKDEVQRFMEDLPVENIPGIGRKMKEGLHGLGIKTCGELSYFSAGILRRRFGIWGDYLSLMARGMEPFSAGSSRDIPRSVGHSITLEQNTGDRTLIRARMLELAEMVAMRLRREKVEARGFSITWRYPDFSTFTKRTTAPFYTQDGKTIWNIVGTLMDSVRLRDTIRLLGVTAFHLKRRIPATPLLGGLDKTQKLHEAVDRINDIFGEYSILRATLLLCTQHHWVISPAYRPHKYYPYRRT